MLHVAEACKSAGTCLVSGVWFRATSRVACRVLRVACRVSGLEIQHLCLNHKYYVLNNCIEKIDAWL